MKQIQIAASALALVFAVASSLAMAAGPQAKTKPGVWQASTALGKPSNGRIVGGITTPAGTRTYQVRLGDDDPDYPEGFCGGTIIADSWVLTAAHCGRPTWIQSGVHDLEDASQGTKHTVAQYIAHPNYNSNTELNDIALVRINGTFSSTLTRARLADAAVMQAVGRPGDLAVVSGWGGTFEGDSYERFLQEVAVPIQSDATCSSSVAYGGSFIAPAMLCAGPMEGGQDSCQGDSGGPLVVTYNNQTYSIGVVSWGNGCARANKPGIYARTSNYLNWINGQIGGGSTVVHNVNLPSVSTGYWSSTYAVAIPTGTTKLVVNTSGGTGDADLYVRRGSTPSTTRYDCRPYLDGNTETCTINNPVAGSTYYIRVRAYRSFSGVNMKATRSP